MTLKLERALRRAALCHRDQSRRGNGVPYFQHAVAVAMILDRLGFSEDVVVAGLLHDVVEDTPTTLDELEREFGPQVAETVRLCSETKTDAEGRKRPWLDRKRDHIEVLDGAPVSARAVVLADKLHNLRSIEVDLREGLEVWSTFHADRSQVLWYYQSMVDRLGKNSPQLETLANECREVLGTLRAM
jgi:guanosine-3',5'-bis(diphosphate) 3'-pyrophosphohydrolase